MSYAPNTFRGKTLESYGHKVEILGRGAYGVVSKYSGQNDSEPVAIKYEMGRDGTPVSAIREITLLKYINHINVVTIFDAYIDSNNSTLMVSELADGTLANAIEEIKKQFDLGMIKTYMYQIARALAYIHSLNIWHRDIKPNNILWYKDGRIKLADFGLARLGSVAGNMYSDRVYTLPYRAPEIILCHATLSGKCNYDDRADVWALGCTFVELVIGKRLFTPEENIDLIKQQVVTIRGFNYEEWPKLQNSTYSDVIKNNKQIGLIKLYPKLLRLGPDGLNLLYDMLTPNPDLRISAIDIMNDKFFANIREDIEYIYPANKRLDMPCDSAQIFRESSNICKPNKKLNIRMLQILYGWVLEVGMDLEADFSTIFYCRQLLGRFLSRTRPSNNNLQGYAIVCFLISSKLNEIDPLDVERAFFIAAKTYTFDQLLKFENTILSIFQFDLAFPMLAEYLVHYSDGLSDNTIKLISDIMIVLTIVPDIIGSFPVSRIVRACVNIGVVCLQETLPECLRNIRFKEHEFSNKIMLAIKKLPNSLLEPLSELKHVKKIDWEQCKINY